MNPLVSVCVPTYNRPASLREAMESVQRQPARQAIAWAIVSKHNMNGESQVIYREFTGRVSLRNDEDMPFGATRDLDTASSSQGDITWHTLYP